MLACSQPEEVIEAGDKQAEVAPEVQDDFDIPESDLVEIELKDREEVKVSNISHVPCTLQLGQAGI